MGIPKFFRYIANKYPNIITDNIQYLDNLFFDLNCLIHPCVHKVINNCPELVIEYNKNLNINSLDIITPFEEQVYLEIERYMKYLINFSVPRKLIYLAIDGVAPRSKMKQQRTRRYKSILEKQMKKKIDIKYKKKSIVFDTNCITPGTLFMKKLSIFLQKFINNLSQTTQTKIILSDSGIIGEGEHKILQYMKSHCEEEVNCIYGLDADLIMLSLVNNCKKSYLLREAVHFGKVNQDSLLFFDVNLFSEKLYNTIEEPITHKYTALNSETEEYTELEISKNRIIKDYICLCFLIGNDFLPHLPGIDIGNKGIDKLLEIYINNYIIKPYYLVNEDNTINFIFMKQIMVKLYNQETNILKDYQKKTDRYRPRLRYDNNYEHELEKLKYYPIFNKKNLFKFTDQNWRDSYYKYYFNITNRQKNLDILDEICENYIDGLQWNCYYYFDTCISYSWYYKYSGAPTFKDICRYFTKRIYPRTFDNIIFTPLEQLSIVLPKESSYLWANNYRKLLDTDLSVAINYPNKFMLDQLNKKFLWECEPILQDMSNKYIKETFSNIILTKTERILNQKSNLYIVNPINS